MNLPDYFLADLPPGAPLSMGLISEACRTLKRNRAQYLAAHSTKSVVEILCEIAAQWRQPDYRFRQLALKQAGTMNGFPAPTLAAGLDAFFSQFTPEILEAFIEQELGHPERLDRFVATSVEHKSHRLALAHGPDLLVHITAGNLPIPALMSVALGLLVRSAQFVKCASGSALLPRLFAHSIYEAAPKLGACLEIAEWPGGQADWEEALYAEADCVTVTGSDETLTEIRRRLPAHVRFLGYGHRVSFGFIAREALSGFSAQKSAVQAANDVAAWNQLGCLSPHLFYLEAGGTLSPDGFAELLAGELAKRECIEPRGTISPQDAAAISARRAFYEVRASASPETRLWQSEGSTAWTVIYEAEPQFQLSCLNRFIYVKAVASLDEALKAAETVREKVSTVGLAAPGQRLPSLTLTLARWGVSRICPLGQMQQPSLSWRHDGRPALENLVTWTDWEHDV